jgi:hypothetical protein
MEHVDFGKKKTEITFSSHFVYEIKKVFQLNEQISFLEKFIFIIDEFSRAEFKLEMRIA